MAAQTQAESRHGSGVAAWRLPKEGEPRQQMQPRVEARRGAHSSASSRAALIISWVQRCGLPCHHHHRRTLPPLFAHLTSHTLPARTPPHLMAMSDNEAPAAPKPEGADQLNIKVKDGDGNEVFFKVKKSTRLGKLRKAYAERMGKPENTVRFLYDGTRVNDDDTAESVSGAAARRAWAWRAQRWGRRAFWRAAQSVRLSEVMICGRMLSPLSGSSCTHGVPLRGMRS
jgi:small ubiquitin-related modifier